MERYDLLEELYLESYAKKEEKMRLEQEWLDRFDILAVNRLAAHSNHRIYASVEECKEEKRRYEKN